MKVPLEIKQLGDLIKEALPDKSYTVIGEVSQPKIFRGNMYLNLKDNFCSIKSIIWKTKYEDFDSEIKDGDKIMVQGKLDFYGMSGSVSFIIEKLLKHSGEGEMHKLFQKYKDRFEKLGYFSDDKKQVTPDKIENILLITSEQGAAIQDFIYNLDNNKSKLNYDIIDIPVQGNSCPSLLIQKLNNIKDKFDIIVITRGGGSFEDLFGFSQPELIEAVYNFNQPILSAIGHQVDTSLLDLVADITCPTPSLAAQFIIDKNKNFINRLETNRNLIKESLLTELNFSNKELSKCDERIYKIILSYERIQQSFQNELLQILSSQSLKLKEMLMKLNLIENYKQNEIKIKKDNKILTYQEFEDIYQHKLSFTINWNNKDFLISF